MNIKEKEDKTKSKKIIFLISKMSGGGAERVQALLANIFYEREYDVEIIVTNSSREEIIRGDLSDKIPVRLLCEMPVGYQKTKIYSIKAKGILSRIVCNVVESMNKAIPAKFAYDSFMLEYHREVHALREYLQFHQSAVLIAFLQPTVPITLLACMNLPNKVIISERADPNRLLKHRYGLNFMRKYYARADHIVFQTSEAMDVYPKEIKKNCSVILNPVKDDLPKAYHGSRTKDIVTFCRISAQKNLPLLIDAFEIVHRKHSDYRLKIIGNPQNDTDGQLLVSLHKQIRTAELEDSVIFMPFSNNVHKDIIDAAVYVNSSDYEGISNAMIEAMAIGMPCVCTDCPIGGARAVIKDHENGLLAPVGNANALGGAMMEVIEDVGLSEKLSVNAADIRMQLDIEQIGERWRRIVENIC